MILTHSAARHVGLIFDCIRAQFRCFDSAFASVVAAYPELEEAQRVCDLLFLRIGRGTYRSRLRPIPCTALGELYVEVTT